MDPLSALSVAANVVQFVNFTFKIIERICELAQSGTGQLQEHATLRRETQRLLGLVDGVQKVLQTDKLQRPLTSSEQALNDVCNECRDQCTQMARLLDKLAVDPELMPLLKELEFASEVERTRKVSQLKNTAQKALVKAQLHWSQLCKSVEALWKRREVEGMRGRLREVQESFMMIILISLRDGSGLSNQTSESTPRPYDTDGWKNLTAAINATVSDSLSRLALDRQGAYDIQLSPWTQTRVLSSVLDDLLLNLSFPEMLDRRERIKDAYANTCNWIFQNPSQNRKSWDDFEDWLSGPAKLYWITGKAGSGKSTLVKYISYEHRTLKSLRKWSGDNPCVIASFFFWNSGTKMQMSQLGLLQSLLHQALSQRRKLCSEALPSSLHQMALGKSALRPWLWTELTWALRILLKEDTGLRYLFIVDGLDEFEEDDKTPLIDFIAELANYPHVKLCVSSRPWVVFEDAYKQKPSLTMHTLTFDDIKEYVIKKFKQSPALDEVLQIDPQFCERLVNDIAEKASGVWLWVVLVVKSLLEGFANGDNTEEIRRRFDALPPDLEELFKKILASLEPAYFNDASRYFQILEGAIGPPTILTMALADQGVDAALEAELRPLTNAEAQFTISSTKRRLNSRCKGLLEPGPPSTILEKGMFGVETPELFATVQYLHRTVKDFIERPDVWNQLTSITANDFNPNEALYTASLMEIKRLHVDALYDRTMWSRILWCVEYAALCEPKVPLESYVGYLDAIDDAATQLCNIPRASGQSFLESSPSNYPGKHWASTIPLRGWTFLSVAVVCNLTSYVEAKLNAGADVSPQGQRPLLRTAVEDLNTLDGFQGHHPICSRTRLNADMVRVLLDHDADPVDGNGNSLKVDRRVGNKADVAKVQVLLDMAHRTMQLQKNMKGMKFGRWTPSVWKKRGRSPAALSSQGS